MITGESLPAGQHESDLARARFQVIDLRFMKPNPILGDGVLELAVDLRRDGSAMPDLLDQTSPVVGMTEPLKFRQTFGPEPTRITVEGVDAKGEGVAA